MPWHSLVRRRNHEGEPFDTPRLVSLAACASQLTRTWVLWSPMRSGLQRAMWTLVESTSGAVASAGTRRPSLIASATRRERPTATPAPSTAAVRQRPMSPKTMRQIGFAFGIALIGALLQRNDPYAYTTAFAVVAA